MNSSNAQSPDCLCSLWTKYLHKACLPLHVGVEDYWGSCQPGVGPGLGAIRQPSEPAEGSKDWPERPAWPCWTASPGPWCGSGWPCWGRAAPARTPWSASQTRRISCSSAVIGCTVGPRSPSTATHSRARSGNRRRRRSWRRGRTEGVPRLRAWQRGILRPGPSPWPWACGQAPSQLWLLTAPELSLALSPREIFPWPSAVGKPWGLLAWRVCWTCCPGSQGQRGASCCWGHLPPCSIGLRESQLRCERGFTSRHREDLCLPSLTASQRVVPLPLPCLLFQDITQNSLETRIKKFTYLCK